MINITSLIDVLFLLLIFLMISSTFLEQPGIKLDLPETQSAVKVKQSEFSLFVDKTGKIFLNDKEISSETLEKRLKEELPNMKGGALILKADTDASHGKVVLIMDIVKKSGVKKLIIGTKQK